MGLFDLTADQVASGNFALNAGTSLINGLSQLGNNIYQRKLQQQLFQREDTSVQRRMADLKAAGLNPNLAAGSAAGAGSVVSTSAPQMESPNMGAILDMKLANANIDYTDAQTRNMTVQNAILHNQGSSDKLKQNLELLNYANNLGIPVSLDENSPNHLILHPEKMTGAKINGQISLDNAPATQMFNWEYQNAENSAALLQGDADFQSIGNFMKFLAPFLRLLSK